MVSYALDRLSLGGRFGTANHRAFVELKAAIDDVLATAGNIQVTCPAGTEFQGPEPLHGDRCFTVSDAGFHAATGG